MISTTEQYRRIDLILLAVLAIAAEVMARMLNQHLTGAGFYLSFSLLIVIIAMIRWGTYGVVVSIAVIIPILILSGDYRLSVIVTQIVSHGSVVVIPLLFKKIPVHQFVASSYLFIGYVSGVFGILVVSNALSAMVFGYSFKDILILTFTQQLLSFIISYLVLLLLKRQKELLVNMEVYFIEKDKEKTK